MHLRSNCDSNILTCESCSSKRGLALTALTELTIKNVIFDCSSSLKGFDRWLSPVSPAAPHKVKNIASCPHMTPIFSQVAKQSVTYLLHVCPHKDQLLSLIWNLPLLPLPLLPPLSRGCQYYFEGNALCLRSHYYLNATLLLFYLA